jgi:uncharacterized protein YbaP (TraB family)
MWRVRSGDHILYLLATISHASHGLYPLPPHIAEPLRASAALLVETDLSKMKRAAIVELASEGVYPSGDSLWNHFSPETRGLVSKFCNDHERLCAEHQLAPQALAKWQPWMAALLTLNLPDLLAGIPIDSEMDRYIQSHAKGHLRIYEINGLAQQLARVKEVPDAQSEAFVAATFRDASALAERRTEQVGELPALWIAGDMQQVEAAEARYRTADSDFLRRVQQESQEHVTRAIAQWLDRGGRCFAAIDLDQLLGADGVLRRLQQAGYQVQQVLAR